VKSLEELLLLNLLRAEKTFDPLTDIVTSLLERGGVAVSGRVHFDTVAAVNTVGCPRSLGVKVDIADGGPLPRILDTVGEVSVATDSIETTLADLSLVGLGETAHVKSLEDTLAHLRPELHFHVLRPHDVEFVLAGNLEEPILSAVLVGPLTARSGKVDLSLSQFPGVVVGRVDASDVGAKLGNLVKEVKVAHVFISLEHVAKSCTVTVLDSLDEDVCVVEHEVVGAHTSGGTRVEENVDGVVGVAKVTCDTLLCDVGSRFLDGAGALFATLDSRGVNLLVELPEINNRLHNT